jgi:hypothetical protein
VSGFFSSFLEIVQQLIPFLISLFFTGGESEEKEKKKEDKKAKI